MDDHELGLPARRSKGRGYQGAAKFFRLSHLRRLRGSEQVAAVCYRSRNGGVEFLLVRTRGGRWTFPKGGLESGLTHAQTAALEAFEEAGVHGRMEEASFARYVRRKRGDAQDSPIELAVNAHLCEVLRQDPPQEFDRNPTWFPPEKAKRRLREDRSPEYGAELSRVVDRALMRIRQIHNGAHPPGNALQKVTFIDDARRRLSRGSERKKK